MQIPLIKNTFLHEEETKKRLSEFILGAKILSMNDQCFEFECRFSKYIGRKESVLFNSGGSANLAMIQSLINVGRLKHGDKVGFSALTWATNVMPIIQLGLTPVPVDCEVGTLNCMSGDVTKCILNHGIKAMFVTNVLGFAGDLDAIKYVCDSYGVILIEDNCEALGTELFSGKTGTFGAMSSCSFYVAHHMSTIEGGIVSTDNHELANMLRIVRANGWDRNLPSEDKDAIRAKFGIDDQKAKYAFYYLGYNLRPTEITGFLGNCQLDYLDEAIKKRNENYRRLESVAIKNNHIVPIQGSYIKFISSFAYPLVFLNFKLKKGYLDQFNMSEIETRPIIAGNITRQPFFGGSVGDLMHNAQFVDDCGFYFGNRPEMTDSELFVIENCLKELQ